MLGRAKNLIQAVLLIPGKVLTSQFTLWRVTGGVGERPGAVLVHVLFSASWDFCCCVHSFVFPSYTKSESLCCTCGLEGVVNAL